MGKIFKSISNPVWSLKRVYEKFYALKKYERMHKASLELFIRNTVQDSLEGYVIIADEFAKNEEINNFVNEQFAEAKLRYQYPTDAYSWPSYLYYFIRKTKPEIIVETGCWYGNSSVAILAALNKNKFGKLYTIDLPAYRETGGYYDENPYINENERTEYLPDGKTPGFIVPEFLKNRWELIFGKSSEKLPSLLNNLKLIDIFLHDSLHSYQNMIFEFELAYEFLKKDGFIFSDNIDWNNAFKDFSYNKNHHSYLSYYETPKLRLNFGAIKKS